VKRWISPILLGLALCGAAHVAATFALPRVIMAIALHRMEAAAGGTNRWLHNARASAATQTIVRTSPDLAYSICVLDLSKGPVVVSLAPWDDYASLAVYDETTDNVRTIGDRDGAPGERIALSVIGPEMTSGAPNAVTLRGTRGLVLARRLAPTQARFEAAQAVQAGDICAPAQ
jgi:uncharacterized membrane protein